MDDIEIEYLDEYKDLVMPGKNYAMKLFHLIKVAMHSYVLGIQKGNDGRGTAAASSEQASSRISKRRRPSSDSSGSSSIDADIFQKLFDGKFHDDDLLHESKSLINIREI